MAGQILTLELEQRSARGNGLSNNFLDGFCYKSRAETIEGTGDILSLLDHKFFGVASKVHAFGPKCCSCEFNELCQLVESCVKIMTCRANILSEQKVELFQTQTVVPYPKDVFVYLWKYFTMSFENPTKLASENLCAELRDEYGTKILQTIATINPT